MIHLLLCHPVVIEYYVVGLEEIINYQLSTVNSQLFLNDRGSDSFMCGVMKALSENGFELLFINAKPQRASCVGDVLCLPSIMAEHSDDGYLAVQKRQLWT